MIRQKIIKLIHETTSQPIEMIRVEHPEEKIHGDYATNIAMVIAGITKKNPLETAKLLSEKIKAKSEKLFEKIEVIKPGFINFFIVKGYLQKQVKEILRQKEKFGQIKISKGKKINIEFISANPTGPLTVGNTRGGFIGDALGNVLRKAGFKIKKAYYFNDCGAQILSLGHSVLKDEQAIYKGEYIDILNKKNKEKDPLRAGEAAAKIIMQGIKKTVNKLEIKFDEWFSEATLHKNKEVDKFLKFLDEKGLLYEKEGAKWFASRMYGDTRDRVLIKADGAKTYLANDIAYHRYKFEKQKNDKAINIWGADHFGAAPSLLAGVEALGHKGKLEIIFHQFVTIIDKGKILKMSKRKGIYVTMDELLNVIGSDVIRFFFLQKSANTHLNFNLDLAVQQSDKNPVYYIQYAYARICAILRKAPKYEIRNTKYETLNHPSELTLIKQMIRFPEIVEDTARDYQVQRLSQYAVDLAATFHQFYRDCRVISENKELTNARLTLILAVKIVLKNTLDLMGISAPEKM